MAGVLGTWRGGFSSIMLFLIMVSVIVFMNHQERHLFMEQGVVERLLSDNEEAEDNGQIIRE